MPSDTDKAVEQVLSGGMEHASEAEILQRLDAELQQQTALHAAVLGEPSARPWVLGGEGAGGFGSMAQRFLNFYADAIHREICDAEKGRVKDEYRGQIGGLDFQDQVKSLVPVVLAAIGVSASFVNPAAIGALVVLWLVRVGLDQWCAAPRASMAQANAGTGATPAAIDPSVSTGATAATPPTTPPSEGARSGSGSAPMSTDPAGTGAAPQPIDPSVSTGAADTTPHSVTDPDVPFDPASTSSNPEVRGEH